MGVCQPSRGKKKRRASPFVPDARGDLRARWCVAPQGLLGPETARGKRLFCSSGKADHGPASRAGPLLETGIRNSLVTVRFFFNSTGEASTPFGNAKQGLFRFPLIYLLDPPVVGPAYPPPVAQIRNQVDVILVQLTGAGGFERSQRTEKNPIVPTLLST